MNYADVLRRTGREAPALRVRRHAWLLAQRAAASRRMPSRSPGLIADCGWPATWPVANRRPGSGVRWASCWPPARNDADAATPGAGNWWAPGCCRKAALTPHSAGSGSSRRSACPHPRTSRWPWPLVRKTQQLAQMLDRADPAVRQPADRWTRDPDRAAPAARRDRTASEGLPWPAAARRPGR